jgi:regulatory protein
MKLTSNKLYLYGIKLLSIRDRSEKELIEKFKNKGYGEEEIRKIIDKLKEQGYVNDYKFALNWVKTRSEKKLLGRRRLEQELRAKGVEEEIIKKCLADFDDSLTLTNMKELLKKKYPGISKGDLKMIRRASSFIQRRGYQNKDLFKLLELINEEDQL